MLGRVKCPGEEPPAVAVMEYEGQQRQALQGASAQGTWCESHIIMMAPAVCILNPSNGTLCWADSETRPQGARLTPCLCKTERRGRGLDSVARDNPADSLMAQDRRCLPYP